MGQWESLLPSRIDVYLVRFQKMFDGQRAITSLQAQAKYGCGQVEETEQELRVRDIPLAMY